MRHKYTFSSVPIKVTAYIPAFAWYPISKAHEFIGTDR